MLSRTVASCGAGSAGVEGMWLLGAAAVDGGLTPGCGFPWSVLVSGGASGCGIWMDGVAGV